MKYIKFTIFIFAFISVSACSAPNFVKEKPVANFAECAAKYPVMESFPRQCKIPDGTVFVEVATSTENKTTAPSAPTCRNLCGDKECQEAVCLSTDCPCAETKGNCPADCPGATGAGVGEQPVVGGDKDEHGCIGSAGYSWCAAKNKCLRAWEETCAENSDINENAGKACIMEAKQCPDGSYVGRTGPNCEFPLCP